MKVYKLVDKIPIAVEKLSEANWTRIAKDTVENVLISTVFLALDHSWGEGGPPILFETMIFGGEHDQYQERYSTWEEAEKGHEEAVNLVKNSLK